MKRLLLLAAVSALAIAGCGETVVDSTKAEDAIEHNLEQAQGTKITAVDCPSDVEVTAGERFECVVHEAGGKEQTATLKILNGDADLSLVDLSPNK
jgi:hypothetical protein